MKILAIRGKNLASLAGEFTVDFTTEPLCSAGIFAITGATGSGKSTLLDALCLALFDKTPRTEGSSDSIAVSDTENQSIGQKDPRSILRRGTTHGYAEVDFKALNGFCYRSSWSVARARDKVSGKLKNAEMRVFRLDNFEEIQGTKTEILFRIQELLGMNFEQFTRSVLLAQNDFSTFLKAKQNEKAELLEKLTGTDIYSRISKVIYARAKNAEDEWLLMHNRIKDIELLPEEVLEKYWIEQSSIIESLSLLQERYKLTEAKLNWIRNGKILIQECNIAQKELENIRIELQQARPRFNQLQRIDSVQPVKEHYLKLNATKKQLLEKNTYCQNLHKHQYEISEKRKTAENSYKQNELQLKKIEDTYIYIEPLLRRARELDIRIENSKKQTERLHSDREKTINELKAVQQETEILQKNIIETEVQIKENNEWFATHEYFKNIFPHISLIQNLIQEADIAQKQKLSNEETYSVLNQTIEEQEKKLIQLRTERENLEKRLPKEIILWRARLSEGTPCPVCGSIHHPVKHNTDNSEEALLSEELEQLKRNADEMIERLSEEIKQTRTSIERCQILIQNYETSYKNAYNGITEYLLYLPDWKTLMQNGTLGRLLEETATFWKTKQEILSRLSEIQSTLNEKISAKTEIINRLSAALKEKELLLITESSQLQQLDKERKTLFEGRLANDIQQNYEKRKQEISELLENSRKILNEITGQHEKLNGILTANENERERFLQEIKIEKQNIENWISEFNCIATQPLSLEELSELLSRSPEWIISEREQLANLSRQENICKATLAERESRLKAHESNELKISESESEEYIIKQADEIKVNIELLQKRNTEISVLLQTHQRNSEKIKLFTNELERLDSISEKWGKLNELLGSQSGDKFKRIAQGYTLDILLSYANKHLHELSSRYELQRIPDSLGLQISDLDMGGEIRSVHSLSGGESFLISLALALGLSSVSSNRMQVESLFIDEGFGSLDADTLRVAMDALERLQTGGRKIGVISHVQEMTERIAVQVRIEKISNGKSRVSVTK
ncbi:AAA family ATPase [Coprobacter sp.]